MNFEVKNAPGVVTIFEKGVFSKLFIEKEILYNEIFVNDNLQDNFLKRRRRRNKKYRLVMKRYKKNKWWNEGSSDKDNLIVNRMN